jgi:hypothetical protein
MKSAAAGKRQLDAIAGASATAVERSGVRVRGDVGSWNRRHVVGRGAYTTPPVGTDWNPVEPSVDVFGRRLGSSVESGIHILGGRFSSAVEPRIRIGSPVAAKEVPVAVRGSVLTFPLDVVR